MKDIHMAKIRAALCVATLLSACAGAPPAQEVPSFASTTGSATPSLSQQMQPCFSDLDVWVQAANEGSISAAYLLGMSYEYGHGVRRDPVRAYQWYRRGAEGGLADAQVKIGTMLASGASSTERDAAAAAVWYQRAAAQGNLEAESNLGALYAQGTGVPKDTALGLTWLRRAADGGNAGAQANLGVIYAHGWGVALDSQQAVAWYRKAALQGYAQAQHNLGFSYENGKGVAMSIEDAAFWYRKAAEQGYAPSQAAIALLLESGTAGVPQNVPLAVEMYTKAANQGYDTAQYNLAVLYDVGQLIPGDDAAAAKWYQQAADQEHASAQSNLGVLYAQGRGVPQSYPMAVLLQAKAARADNQNASLQLYNNIRQLAQLQVIDPETRLHTEPMAQSPASQSIAVGATVYALSARASWTLIYLRQGNQIGFVPTAAVRQVKPATTVSSAMGVPEGAWRDKHIRQRAWESSFPQAFPAPVTAAQMIPPGVGSQDFGRYREEVEMSIRSNMPTVRDQSGPLGHLTLFIFYGGTIGDIRLSKSSGDCAVDREAVLTALRYDHFPAVPWSVVPLLQSVVVDVNF